MKDLIDRIQDLHKTGQPVVEALFKLTDKELKEKIKSICGNQLHEDFHILFNTDSEVTRTIVREKPSKISIAFYDSLEISFMGVYLHPEHGENKCLVEFNEHFKL